MKIYFTFRNIPEMANIPETDRSTVWQSFLKVHGYFSWEAIAALVPFFLVLYCGEFVIQQIEGWLNISRSSHAVLFILIAVPASTIVLCGIYISLMREPFKRYLATRG